jgi:hypothetical protein
VKEWAGAATAHQQQMFRESLHAVLAVTEIREMPGTVGLGAANHGSSRDDCQGGFLFIDLLTNSVHSTVCRDHNSKILRGN